ncbi:MAG: uracil-DNA glycosylase [Acidiferrobacterales bacterium]|nr:uracil-DNA glycosylase [Acidiferrobacterales bacterium]
MDVRALQVAVAGCQRCQLSKTRTNTVFGAGSLDADLLFIGEGPGHQEDLQGLPFVGRAGKLLTAMIAAVGFERDQVYIANVVKCRPPNNRDPLSDEASACSHYLRRQIEIIRPKVIVALGRVSAQLLLDTDAPLRELRGKPQKYRDTDVDVVVTYHPAYLLRKATEKRKSWDDLWKVRLMLNQS